MRTKGPSLAIDPGGIAFDFENLQRTRAIAPSVGRRKREITVHELLLDRTIVAALRLEGPIHVDRLCDGATRVQGRHPALRCVVVSDGGRLRFESEVAARIPIRVVARTSDDDWEREAKTEWATRFRDGQPLLRIVAIGSEESPYSELIFTTNHMIADGMSTLTIVREVLASLDSDVRLEPSVPPSVEDVIRTQGGAPQGEGMRRLKAALLNAAIALTPAGDEPPTNESIFLRWAASPAQSRAIFAACKERGVTVHAALLTALSEVFQIIRLRNAPATIHTPIDPRRRGLYGLEADMLFPMGGSYRTEVPADLTIPFWLRANAMRAEMLRREQREVTNIPAKFGFAGMVATPTRGQMNSLVKFDRLLGYKFAKSTFGLSNLGTLDQTVAASGVKVTDLRLFVHSHNFATYGLVYWTMHSRLTFALMSEAKLFGHHEMKTVRDQLMAVLDTAVSK